MKGNNCDWLHVGLAGTALVEGAQQPGAVEVANDAGEKPLCKWTKKGMPCRDFVKGKCPMRHDVKESDGIGLPVSGTNISVLEVKMSDRVFLEQSDSGSLGSTIAMLQVSGEAVVAAFESADTALGKGAVLVDTGANEVVRPFQKRWYEEIWRGEKGTPLRVNMADGKYTLAAMTQFGEVMLPVLAEDKTAESARWIVPTCRMIDELGCSLNLNSDGMVVNFPGGKKIMTIKMNGLNFITWKDFIGIKDELAISHRVGRKAYKGVYCKKMDVLARLLPGGNGMEMDMYSENHWLEWTKTKGPTSQSEGAIVLC